MQLPPISPKRWFWATILLGIAWSAIGSKWGGTASDPGVPRSIQSALVKPLDVLLVPAEFVFASTQGIAQGAILRATAKPDTALDLEAIKAERDDLRNENAYLKDVIAADRERLAVYKQLSTLLLQPQDVLQANILGGQAGPGTSRVHLDKGSVDGVKPKMPILVAVTREDKAHPRLTVVGRVVTVGPKDAWVQLLTDPQLSVTGEIVRPQLAPKPEYPLPDLRVTTEPSLFTGIGNNQLESTDIYIESAVTPQRGDVVLLSDTNWPAAVQHMPLGQIVEDVGRRDLQPLRYRLHISPRVTVSSQRTVMIVLKE